jgi:hypothetical protein
MEPPGRIHLPGLDRSLPPRGLRETLRETIGSTYDQQLRLALKQQLIGLSRGMESSSDAQHRLGRGAGAAGLQLYLASLSPGVRQAGGSSR